MEGWWSQETWVDLFVALGILVGAWLLGWLLSKLFVRLVVQLVRRSRTEADDLLVSVLGRQLPWWFVAAAGPVAARIVGAEPKILQAANRAAQALLILSITLGVSRFVAGLLARGIIGTGGTAATTLTQKLARFVIVLLGLLVLLNNLGVQITPILTALGVGSLAVGLALQPTLTNIFAGFHLTTANRIRVGDYIRLEGGQEGVVTDIGLRSTVIHDPSNNIILIPNAKLVEMIVVNLSQPDPQGNFPVPSSVAYGSNLEQVERIVIETARQVQKGTPGAVTDWEPLFRVTKLSESAIDFHVVLRAQNFPDRGPITHEYLKHLEARLRAEGFEPPFPHRIVHHAGETAERTPALS